MLNITIDMVAGVAKSAQTALIKAGGMVPVTVTFSSAPGALAVSAGIELALSPQSQPPAVVAYLDTFDEQSDTVFTGWLNANDTRLLALLAGKSSQVLDCEMVITTIANGRQPFPSFPVTTQLPILTGTPQSSEGGPTWPSPGSLPVFVSTPSTLTDFSTLPGSVSPPAGSPPYFAIDEAALWIIKAGQTAWKKSTLGS